MTNFVATVGLLVLVTAPPVAAQMSDRQFDDLSDVEKICFRRQQGDITKPTYEKGFQRCEEIVRTFVMEWQRRQRESVQQDLQDIGSYLQTWYPPNGKLK